MATVTVLKNTPTHAVVKVWGTAGAATITLATDLKLANQTATTPVVNITGIVAACVATSGNTIVRNSNVLWNLPQFFKWRSEGWADNQDNTSNIVVTLGTGGGTIVLELAKNSGYGDTAHNPLL